MKLRIKAIGRWWHGLSRPRRTDVVIVAICLCVIVGASAVMASVSSSTASAAASDGATISSLSTQLSAVQAQTVPDAASTGATLSNARAAGNAVAELQNEYLAAIEDTAGASAVASGMDAYLGDGASGSRTPWLALPGATWSFETTYDFDGTSVPVLWCCRDAAGDILAYETADYSPVTSRFTDCSGQETTFGLSLQNDLAAKEDS